MAYLNTKEGRIVGRGGQGKKLTPKMLSFINAYFGEAKGNGLEAIRLSDYNCRTKASIHQTYAELMNHPLVKAEMGRRHAVREQEAGVKADYLIAKLIQIIEDTQQDNPQAALRAIELAGKSIALWRERQEVTGADGDAIRVEQERKENVADFTSRIASLANRGGEKDSTVIPFRGGEG